MTPRLPALVLTLLPLVVAACAPLGPNYTRPTITPPAAYRGAQVNADQARSLADLPWFDLFKEPELAALIREALDHNLDLTSAIARVEQFRGQAILAGLALKPVVGGSFTVEPSPTSGLIDNEYSAGLAFNWEVDFFGRLRRTAEAARANLLASEDGSRSVMATVASGVAQGYIQLRFIDEQLAITRRTAALQEDALRVVQALAQGGVSSGTDVQQAINQLAGTRAVLPRLQRQQVQIENRVSVLLGRPPSEIVRASAGRIPDVPDVPAGLPSTLLERRPDIRSAENQLRAAVANVGVAVASKPFVPVISLTTGVGRVSSALLEFFTVGGDAANLLSFGGVFQTLFYDAGRGKARERVAWAQAEQAALQYRSVILQSFREVADALATLDTITEEIAQNQTRVVSAREYLRLTGLRYRGGVSSYLEVIDAQRQLFSAELDWSSARQSQLLAVIDLYRALGGGWSDEELRKLAARPMAATR